MCRKDDVRLESVKALRSVARSEDKVDKIPEKEKLADFVAMISFIKEKVTLFLAFAP